MANKEDNEKIIEYATLITEAITDKMEEDEMDFRYIDWTAFIYALSTVAPATMYNKLMGEEKNFLEFNHIANQLCFQYGMKDDKED